MTGLDKTKFAVCMSVIIIASLMLWQSLLSGQEWVSASTWTVTAYVLGEIGAVVAGGMRVESEAKAEAIRKGQKV